jgi:hypothetical protein
VEWLSVDTPQPSTPDKNGSSAPEGFGPTGGPVVLTLFGAPTIAASDPFRRD